MGKKSKLLRVQNLFARGEILLVADGDEVVTFWVARLNTFEDQEVRKDAQTGRVRAMTAFDADGDEQLKLTDMIAEMTDQDLALALSRDKQFDHLNRARAEVTTNPDWAERLELIETEALDGATSEEIAAIAQASAEFQAEVLKQKAQIDIAFNEDLLASGRASLEKEYRKSYRQVIGANAFYEYRSRSEVFRGLRDCSAVLNDDGGWDHSACGYHQDQVLEDREEVVDLPDELMGQFIEIWNRLTMSEDEAGKSAAPSASSGS